MKEIFTIKEASSQNWSSRVLERNIKSGYYKRLLSTQQNKVQKENEPIGFTKDPYVLEFLNLPEDLTGKEIYTRTSVD